jgi:ADP-ribose pyrophosphatase
MAKSVRRPTKSSPSRKKKLTKARVLSRKLVYRGPVFWITSERVEEPTGVRALREVVRHTGSVVVLATEENGAEPLVLLERQYRHAAESFLWELPAGRIDKGEKALAAAKRELLEETGYTARSVKQILEIIPSPGFCTERMWIFAATGLREGTAQPEEDEKISAGKFSLAALEKMIRRGTLHDGKSVSAILFYSRFLTSK